MVSARDVAWEVEHRRFGALYKNVRFYIWFKNEYIFDHLGVLGHATNNTHGFHRRVAANNHDPSKKYQPKFHINGILPRFWYLESKSEHWIPPQGSRMAPESSEFRECVIRHWPLRDGVGEISGE